MPIVQSKMLYDKLKLSGYPTALYEIKGGKHGNFGETETRKMEAKMLEFLNRYLR